jgi:hypothetical protein
MSGRSRAAEPEGDRCVSTQLLLQPFCRVRRPGGRVLVLCLSPFDPLDWSCYGRPPMRRCRHLRFEARTSGVVTTPLRQALAAFSSASGGRGGFLDRVTRRLADTGIDGARPQARGYGPDQTI